MVKWASQGNDQGGKMEAKKLLRGYHQSKKQPWVEKMDFFEQNEN